jgi:hypothetical protein
MTDEDSYNTIRDSVWNVNVKFNAKDKNLFICNIKGEQVSIPRKHMIMNFNRIFEVSRINDLIRNKTMENLINEKNSI